MIGFVWYEVSLAINKRPYIGTPKLIKIKGANTHTTLSHSYQKFFTAAFCSTIINEPISWKMANSVICPRDCSWVKKV